MLLVASETVARAGAFPWHCSRLWVINAGSELNCFLHFPQRKTSSSSRGQTRIVAPRGRRESRVTEKSKSKSGG
jgi:hypothetical protein